MTVAWIAAAAVCVGGCKKDTGAGEPPARAEVHDAASAAKSDAPAKTEEPTMTFEVRLEQAEEGSSMLRLHVDNRSSKGARFSKYHTPFEGIRNSFLEVKDSTGAEIDYAGVMAKRAPPGPEDYLTVPAKGRLSASFELKRAYDVKAGTYTVRFVGGEVSGLPDSKPITVVVSP